MNLRFVRNASLVLIILGSAASAAVLSDGLQNGENYYFAGEFKKAISQFELAMNANPDDPQPYLWLGKSYVELADLKTPPFGARARVKARMYLAKSVELAPGCDECRRELFDLLITSDGSRTALREASLLVEKMPASDPEYGSMQSRLAEAWKQSSSAEYLTTAIFSFPSQTVARIAVRPAPFAHSRREMRLRKVANTNKETVPSWRGESAREDLCICY